MTAELTVWTAILLVLLGLLIGTISGMVGIGGGILVIPALIFFFGFTQAQANGTSLAMLLPPIGIFAVVAYWRAGNVAATHAAWLACGFSLGAYFGAKLVNGGYIHPTALRVAFAILLLYIAGRILFRPGGEAMAALETWLLVIGFVGSWLMFRAFGRRFWRRPAPDWGAIYRSKLRTRPSQSIDYEI
jgi:uncharacterized membrane protein YfcA